MSQKNVAIVRRAYDAFDREGLDGLLFHLDPRIEWTTTEAISSGQPIAATKRCAATSARCWPSSRISVTSPGVHRGGRAGRLFQPGQRPGQTQRRTRRAHDDVGRFAARRQDRPHPQLRGHGRSPPSRRAAGVGRSLHIPCAACGCVDAATCSSRSIRGSPPTPCNLTGHPGGSRDHD